jgi:hypothetical protein
MKEAASRTACFLLLDLEDGTDNSSETSFYFNALHCITFLKKISS